MRSHDRYRETTWSNFDPAGLAFSALPRDTKGDRFGVERFCISRRGSKRNRWPLSSGTVGRTPPRIGLLPSRSTGVTIHADGWPATVLRTGSHAVNSQQGFPAFMACCTESHEDLGLDARCSTTISQWIFTKATPDTGTRIDRRQKMK